MYVILSYIYMHASQVGAERTIYDDNMQGVDATISKCNAAMKAIRAAMVPGL